MQNDIKKVLAYSTVSQLGYMMMGLGVGAWVPAVFHIFTHAFFKCCLFLCAGSVAHTGSHHSFDMKKDMGGLRKKMPITFVHLDAVSTAALCGVPFFSGFFSKDEIIDSARHFHYTRLHGHRSHRCVHDHRVHDPSHLPHLLRRATRRRGPLRARCTTTTHADAACTTTSHGHDTHAPGADVTMPDTGKPLGFAPTDSPWLITVPLLILGFLAVVAGYLNAAREPVRAPTIVPSMDCPSSIGVERPRGTRVRVGQRVAVASLLVAAGFLVSLALCKQVFGNGRIAVEGSHRSATGLLGAGHTFLGQQVLPRRPLREGHRPRHRPPDRRGGVLDQPARARRHRQRVGIGGRKTGDWVYKNVDQRVVDGAVNGSGAVARGTGGALQPVQSGKVSLYGALLFGAAAVGALVLVLVNS